MVRTRGKGHVTVGQEDASSDEDNVVDSEDSEKSAVLKPTHTRRNAKLKKGELSDGEPADVEMEQRCSSSSRTNSRLSSTAHRRINQIKLDELGQDLEHDVQREAGFVCEVSTEDSPGCKKGKRHRVTKSRKFGVYHEELRNHTRNKRVLVDTDYLSESEEGVDNGDVEYVDVRTDSSRRYKSRAGTDGIRRSTRQRKPTRDEVNGSWIFGTQNPKGYPAYDEEQEDDGACRRSSRLRSSHQPVRPKQENMGNGNEHETEESEKSVDEKAEDDGPASGEDDEEEEYGQEAGKKARRVQNYRKNRTKQLSEDEDEDMYTKVKRHRTTKTRYVRYRGTRKATRPRPRKSRNRVRHRYTVPSTDDSPSEDESENSSDRDTETTEAADKEENAEGDPIEGRNAKGKYTLRKIRPVAKLQSLDNKSSSRSSTPPPRYRRKLTSRLMCSPAHRTLRRPRQTAQNESSTSSSSDDDERFERRKNKSMIKARNRCLPMNLTAEDLGQGVLKERSKVGSSLADVDPMAVDKNVTFQSVGGLDSYIRSLKEMILFPLLYPEVFQKFTIQPPRGVLFYGPPGTGKTLVARALSNECSQEGRRVAFFMRKGADCLSKWVGESERQLRLLFDQAYQMRPSIIFFDEIDGLAPVRSTRQDQIHSSIVSTLLALMDGLDSRGEVVVIGATNRLDAIDPALRRPGRFDREFFFPLPSVAARKEILNIHLKSWQPSPAPPLIHALAEKTVGYCGADLKALCAEAALISLRRRYPQIYESKQKLLLDLTQINVEKRDFLAAMSKLVPASHRAGTSAGKPLSTTIAPLLKDALQQLINTLANVFPQALNTLNRKGPVSQSKAGIQEVRFSPRLYVAADQGCHLTAALLHYLERVPVHRLDLTTLYGLSVRSPEEACVQIFQEARRNVPSIIYLSQVSSWWGTLSETVRATLFTLIRELDPELPVMLLVSDEVHTSDITEDLQTFFEDQSEEVFTVPKFTEDDRRVFFSSVIQMAKKPPTVRRKIARIPEVLPIAPLLPARQLSSKEKARLEMKEEFTLRELRIFLREVLAKLARNKLFYMFTRPVDVKAVPDYTDIIKEPMDLETMMTKIDNHCYESAKDFLADIDLICNNALEYNPSKTPEDKLIRHRAFTLRDTAYALIKAEMDTDFEDQCQEISRARKARQTPQEEERLPEPSTAAIPEENTPSAPVVPVETKDKPEPGKPKRKKSSWARGVVPSRRSSKRSRTDDSVNSTETDKNDTVQQESVSMDCSVNGCVASEEPVAEQTEVQPTDELQDNYTAASQTESEAPEQRDDPENNIGSKTLTVDEKQLDEILGNIVMITEHFALHDLLRLHGKLNQVVSRYSKLWDRVALPQELETVVNSIQRQSGDKL